MPRKPGQNSAASPFSRGALPGKGFAISYTPYDAFALLLGLHLLDSNVPQMAVIRLLRLIRPELEREHERILRLSPKRLAQSKHGLESRIKEGLLVEDPRKMIFLVLPTGAGADLLYRRKQDARSSWPTSPVAGRAGRCRCPPHARLAAGPGVRADQPGPSARLVARTRSPDPSRTSLN